MARKRRNAVVLVGTIASPAVKDREFPGTEYYRFDIAVRRRSGIVDTIEGVYPDKDGIEIGKRVQLKGEYCSKNIVGGHHPHVKLYLKVKEITNTDKKEDENYVVIKGRLYNSRVKETRTRGEIAEAVVAVRKPFGSRRDYIPLVLYGKNAQRIKAGVNKNNYMILKGRIQSRDYMKIINGNLESRRAHEVSVSEMTVM